MNLSTKTKVIIVVVYTVSMVALGAWIVPIKTKEVVKTVTQDKIVYKDRVVKQTNKSGTITKHQERRPDGTVITDTKLSYNDKNDQVTTKDDTENKAVETTKDKETQRGDSKVTIMGLGGYDIQRGQVVYGASVSKPIIGPFVIGGFGLSNGVAGIGAGITF